jgi:flagellar hook-associated protein 1 FlgK
MSNYSIGLSGLDAAQKALDVIGNNIANSATEGYHRQRVDFSPAYSSQQGSILIGGGVDIQGVTRVIDNLLEQEILRQQSSLGHVSQEFGTLRTIENVFGELSAEDSGLNATIDKFFNSLQDLSANPMDTIWQNQIVSNAKAMASQFRTIGEFLNRLETQIRLEVENTVDFINVLTSQIAALNDKIEAIEMPGGNANNLRDQRDQSISELSELIGVQTLNRPYGVVDVTAGEIPLVIGVSVYELERSFSENADLGISITGSSNCITNAQGGKIGGLLSLKNELVSDIHDNLDLLATALIQQINQYHVQGVGSEGSFTSLTGWANASGDLADFSTVAAGYTYIRVTNTSTGEVTRTAIAVLQDASSDTLTEIAGFINGAGVANVAASVNSSNQLTISADTGYTYDFLPAVLPEPTAKSLTGADEPLIAVSGIYTGTTNSTFTFTVVGPSNGQIGVTDGLELELSKDGTVVKKLNVGLGYESGAKLDLGDGLYVSLNIDTGSGNTKGDLNLGDDFEVKAWANTDTSGLLSAVGINTFFYGNSADDIAVRSDIIANPRRVATALGAEMTDNDNVKRMADVRDEAISGLGSLTSGEFYRQLVTDIGQQLSVRQMQQDNIEVIVLNLTNQRSETSGVDINDEAAQLLVFQQMFQAMAKYMSTINSSLSSIMELL